MLRSLHIENYALIRQTDIQFDDGFVVITGETGAGKTILLDALGLLLGQRADSRMIGNKECKCIVEAVFDINGLNLIELFNKYDIDYDNTLIVRREVLPSGKSRSFVNDTPSDLNFLKLLGSHLVDIHSQHETLLLADNSFRINLLDTYAGNSELLQQYREHYKHYTTEKQRLEKLSATSQQNRKDIDYWQFLFDELNDAHLDADEQEKLEEEEHLLTNAEEIKSTLGQVVQLCNDDEHGIVMQLRTAHHLLSHATSHLKEIAELEERMESARIELSDLCNELDSLNEHIVYSAERQQEVDDRLSLIYRLEKKHGVDSIAALLAVRDDLQQRLLSVSNIEDDLQQAMEEVDKAFHKVQEQGTQLTKQRQIAATRLGQALHATLSDLGMGNTTLRFEVGTATSYGPNGIDTVQIFFNANCGGEARELSKVASGGEMSRIMLALKSHITAKTLLPTIIFDEIDTGISGDISLRAGQILRCMSANMQVVAITHSPQIAALAQQHLKVYKTLNGEGDELRTISNITPLTAAQREQEIATMLSSDNPTAAALQTARELLSH